MASVTVKLYSLKIILAAFQAIGSTLIDVCLLVLMYKPPLEFIYLKIYFKRSSLSTEKDGMIAPTEVRKGQKSEVRCQKGKSKGQPSSPTPWQGGRKGKEKGLLMEMRGP
jgi:hypothetical protein